MTEPRYRGFIHVSDEDSTETRPVTPEQMRAIALLEIATPGCPLVRLSLAQWRHVDRVVIALGALGVPAPRNASDDQPNGER